MTVTVQDIPKQGQETPANRLRKARDDAGITRKALHEMTGISPRSIEHYESGQTEPPISRLKALAEALNVSVDFIIHGDRISDESADETFIAPILSETSDGPEIEPQTDLEKARALLARMDELRMAGLQRNGRKVKALLEDCADRFRYLNHDEIRELGEHRNLADPEFILKSRFDELVNGDGEQAGEEKTTLELLEDEDHGQELENLCGEILERVVDTALFGEDLYSMDMEKLKEFADNNDIEPDRFMAFRWRGHAEIVPAIRAHLREEKLSGRDAL